MALLGHLLRCLHQPYQLVEEHRLLGGPGLDELAAEALHDAGAQAQADGGLALQQAD
jgi:hypothetical protein